MILDAGTGAGFMARRFRDQGALVWACDRNPEGIEAAIAMNPPVGIQIRYDIMDITDMTYSDGKFNKVACVGVLLHNNPEDCLQFFREAYRVLQKGGLLVVSSNDPFLFKPESPARNGLAGWLRLDRIPGQDGWFTEHYTDSQGRVFTSPVYNHPEGSLQRLVQKAGFEIKNTQKMYLTREIMEACNQEGPVGYPVNEQIVAVK
jgi:ubiquinone/menaquinone biosynthesis C-methylase UbiE